MDKRTFISYTAGLATIVAIFAFIFILRAVFFGGVYFVASDTGFSPPPQAEAATTSSLSLYEPDYETPSRLLIPAISVKAKVQHVGLTRSNAMGIPTNFSDVGWYKFGTVPGEMGSSVVAGHVDNALGLPGVFARLKELKRGDEVYVIDKNGAKIKFIVTGIERYKYKEVPTDEIFNTTGKAYLKLITCGGRWIRSEKTYDERIIVTAEAAS